MKRLWLLAALPAVMAGFVFLSGALVDPRYHAGAAIRVEATPEAVWNILTAIDDYPRWRSDVVNVEVTRYKPSPTWSEYDAQGRSTAYAEAASAPPGKWVSRITSGNLPMRADRTFLIVPMEDGGTRIAVSEDGEIKNPVERFRYRFQIGYTAALEKYLSDLRKRLGE